MGRINRATYWCMLAAWLAIGGLVVIFQPLSPVSLVGSGIGLLAPARLHDMGRSGWWLLPLFAFLLATFVATLYMPKSLVLGAAYAVIVMAAIALGLIPGNPGANRYGEPWPVRRR